MIVPTTRQAGFERQLLRDRSFLHIITWLGMSHTVNLLLSRNCELTKRYRNTSLCYFFLVPFWSTFFSSFDTFFVHFVWPGASFLPCKSLPTNWGLLPLKVFEINLGNRMIKQWLNSFLEKYCYWRVSGGTVISLFLGSGRSWSSGHWQITIVCSAYSNMS